MSGSEKNPLFCSFVGVQYLVCECGEAFENEESLRVHLDQKHPRLILTATVRNLKKVPPPITEYKCGECGQVYDTEEACVAHQEIDHIPFMEELVYEEEVTADAVETIVPELVVQDTPSTPSVPTYKSPVKNQAPVRVQSLPATKRVAPEKKQLIQQGQRKRRPYVHKNVQCETCGKKYASNAALRYHQRVHTGVKPYHCPYCPKSFTMSLFMQVHIRTHTGEKPYQCPNCPKAFGNRAALLRHDRVHTGIKPYQCPKCGKCFTQSNSMKLHFHTVHLKLPTPYKSKRRRAELDAREGGRKTKHPSDREVEAQLHFHTVHLKLPTPYKSKRRRAELDAREGGRKPKHPTDREVEAQVQLIKTELQDSDEGEEIYVKTPAGRKITLATIVPRKAQQQALLQSNTIDVPPQPANDEILYYIKPEAEETEEQEVTYEVIYE
ncbi:hypothetical protein ABMA28_012736 [Loxostege sticticalis]|uniref:C2H2-type domain-containing protein n=1 Tax=Loxostege sticticalis TaxID=481309 RepID=A0ABD0S5T8_LOXSC